MKWSEEYSLGIKEIDDQHRGLLLKFSVIEEAIQLHRGWADIHQQIMGLKDLARMHFAFEEGLMRLFGYREAADHRRAHEYFFIGLEEIASSALRNAAEARMLAFLQDWLTTHILGSDRDYARHILSGAAIVRSESAATASLGGIEREGSRFRR